MDESHAIPEQLLPFIARLEAGDASVLRGAATNEAGCVFCLSDCVLGGLSIPSSFVRVSRTVSEEFDDVGHGVEVISRDRLVDEQARAILDLVDHPIAGLVFTLRVFRDSASLAVAMEVEEHDGEE